MVVGYETGHIGNTMIANIISKNRILVVLGKGTKISVIIVGSQ